MVAAKSTTERMADMRARRKEEGGKEIAVFLDRGASRALDSITSRSGESQSEAVCRAVVKLNAEEEAQQPQK